MGVQVSPGERMLADLAEEQWNEYKRRFVPLEEANAARAMAKLPGEHERAIGKSVADTYSQNGSQIRGLNPNTGRIANLGVADMAGRSAAFGERAQTGEDYARKLNAIQTGKGLSASSIAGLSSSAQIQARNEALREETKAAISQNNASMYGSLAGMATGAGMYYMANRKPTVQPVQPSPSISTYHPTLNPGGVTPHF